MPLAWAWAKRWSESSSDSLKNGVYTSAAVMTAHVIYNPIDPVYPGTMSRTILEGILRQQLGFNGLIVGAVAGVAWTKLVQALLPTEL